MRRDSRALILRAATTEFALHGFGGARIERIAKQAGVNKQLLFYYFTSKAGLYAAVLNATTIDVTGAGGAASLRQLLATIFQRFSEQPEALALLLHSVRRPNPPEPSVVLTLSRPWREIRDLISAGQGVGMVRDNVDPDSLAAQAIVLLVGFLLLEPVLMKMPSSPSVDWPATVSDMFTRILAW